MMASLDLNKIREQMKEEAARFDAANSTVYWSIPQNPSEWGLYGAVDPASTGSHYTATWLDDIEESSPSQESLQKTYEWFKSRPEYVGKYEGRLWVGSMNPPEKPRGKFELLLEDYDNLLSRFGVD